jgi:rRNA maturation endonuclease Nob1
MILKCVDCRRLQYASIIKTETCPDCGGPLSGINGKWITP